VSTITETGLDAALSKLRQAYTLLVSAEPTLIRDARTAPNPMSAHYKAVLRDRVKEWLDPIRDNFDGWATALAPAPSDSLVETHRITGALLHRAWLKSGRPDPLLDADAWDGFALTVKAVADIESGGTE